MSGFRGLACPNRLVSSGTRPATQRLAICLAFFIPILYIAAMAKRKGATESIISGLAFTVVFGVLWGVVGGWWWIFPLMFAGVVPMIEGLRRLASERSRNRIEPEKREAIAEREVLKIAQAEEGIVTPSKVALKTNLTLERAEEVLQKLATRGFASMQVTDAGIVQYEFPEFRSRIGDSSEPPEPETSH